MFLIDRKSKLFQEKFKPLAPAKIDPTAAFNFSIKILLNLLNYHKNSPDNKGGVKILP